MSFVFKKYPENRCYLIGIANFKGDGGLESLSTLSRRFRSSTICSLHRREGFVAIRFALYAVEKVS